MDMDVDKSKLFIGGISRETTEEALRDHFGKYGAVLGSLVAKDKNTGTPRGFGFVWFSDPSIADKALGDTHVIRGRTVDVKKAVPKSEQVQFQQQQTVWNQQKKSGFGKNGSNSDSFKTKKIFVGGLASNLTEEQFRNYFEKFGRIVDVVVMQDSFTNRPRGFGFVTFNSEESVDRVMEKSFHQLNGRLVEVKRAVPKDEISNSSSNVNFTRGGVIGTSNQNPQLGNYHPVGPVFEIPRGYGPVPGYSASVGGYFVSAGVHGPGYPVLGYGRPGFGMAPFAHRSPWSGPMIIAPGSSPVLYSGTALYPPYVNGGAGMMHMVVGGFDGAVNPAVNGNMNQAFVGNGHLLPVPTSSVDKVGG